MKKHLALFLAALTFGACTSTRPIAATSNPIGSKTGKASQVVVFGMHFGDASVGAAAKAGGLRTISFVDFRNTNLLFLYQRHTCIVNGD